MSEGLTILFVLATVLWIVVGIAVAAYTIDEGNEELMRGITKGLFWPIGVAHIMFHNPMGWWNIWKDDE